MDHPTLTSNRARRIEPRGLRKPDSADYVGVSESQFDTWIDKGLMPKGKKIGGVKLWDRAALDRALDALFDTDPTDAIWDHVS